jgi:hypothetical protein
MYYGWGYWVRLKSEAMFSFSSDCAVGRRPVQAAFPGLDGKPSEEEARRSVSGIVTSNPGQVNGE